ncbi:MAG: protein kinase, partial [Lachnospiraceae bacterium]|nr:protein kinase [Lachnospiraceae bacterium]
MLKPGTIIGNRYEILETVGSGGMSIVYKAKCHKLNRYVAIKMLKPEFSDDKGFVTKFRVEAQSAACLSHPNIVSVFDVGEDEGMYYIVMELVEGIT